MQGTGFGWEASPAQTHPSIIDIIKTSRRTIRNIIGQSLTCQSNCAGAQLACFPTLLSNHEERLPKRAFKIKGPTTNIQKKAVLKKHVKNRNNFAVRKWKEAEYCWIPRCWHGIQARQGKQIDRLTEMEHMSGPDVIFA